MQVLQQRASALRALLDTLAVLDIQAAADNPAVDKADMVDSLVVAHKDTAALRVAAAPYARAA